jgi:hypothetical protein
MSRSFLLALDKVNSLYVLKAIAVLRGWGSVTIQTQPSQQFFKSTNSTENWRKRKISNFQYLIELNAFSSRSFNDSRICPVFPWVLADYTSSNLDMTERDTFRPLGQPMGVINAQRLELLKPRSHSPDQSLTGQYLYNSSYSAPLSLFNWMIRVEPFTSLHIQAQSGRFDLPTRLFTSVQIAYELSSTTVGDYQELPPELYFDHLVLLNRNGFDLGKVRGSR